MNKGSDYAAVVIPPDFTSSLLALADPGPTSGAVPRTPAIAIRTNERLGSIGTGLASGVLQPALTATSGKIGHGLLLTATASNPSPALKAQLVNPVTLSVVVYRPLPPHSALGLSAFYISLLTLMCGFLGATIVHSSVDAASGTPGPGSDQVEPAHPWRSADGSPAGQMGHGHCPRPRSHRSHGARCRRILGMDAPDTFLRGSSPPWRPSAWPRGRSCSSPPSAQSGN